MGQVLFMQRAHERYDGVSIDKVTRKPYRLTTWEKS